MIAYVDLLAMAILALSLMMLLITEIVLEETKFCRAAEILVRAVSIVLVFLLVMLCAPAQVRARDDGRYANSSNHEWFEGLTSSGGSRCCSDADGRVVYDSDWEASGDHYRVRIDSVWYNVPDTALIKEPNRVGRTMVWPYYADGKVHHIVCFLPGAGI